MDSGSDPWTTGTTCSSRGRLVSCTSEGGALSRLCRGPTEAVVPGRVRDAWLGADGVDFVMPVQAPAPSRFGLACFFNRAFGETGDLLALSLRRINGFREPPCACSARTELPCTASAPWDGISQGHKQAGRLECPATRIAQSIIAALNPRTSLIHETGLVAEATPTTGEHNTECRVGQAPQTQGQSPEV